MREPARSGPVAWKGVAGGVGQCSCVDICETGGRLRGGAVWPQTVTLGAGAATVGRDEGCDVVIADSSLMSGTHACLYIEEDGRVQVEDLGSEHGTFIGGQPAHERRLARGERLVLDKSGRGVRLADVLLLVYVGTLKPAEWELQMPAQ